MAIYPKSFIERPSSYPNIQQCVGKIPPWRPEEELHMSPYEKYDLQMRKYYEELYLKQEEARRIAMENLQKVTSKPNPVLLLCKTTL